MLSVTIRELCFVVRCWRLYSRQPIRYFGGVVIVFVAFHEHLSMDERLVESEYRMQECQPHFVERPLFWKTITPVDISSPGKPDSEAYECAYGRYTKEPAGVREKSSRS